MDRRANLPLALIFADVDGLKIANDTLGHFTGDRILKRTAEVIQKNCRDTDIVARWGGDEFVILLPKADAKATATIGNRIEEALKNERVSSVPISVSLGWHSKTEVDLPISDLVKRAENHMLKAKMVQSPGIRNQMLLALMAALYEKNPREEQHCRRVSELSQLLGKSLGLSERDTKELGIIGLFHDIGKVSISEEILNKTAELTEEEWVAVKAHPEVGYRVLSHVQDMAEIADFVLSHHERWDGKGYPRGLEGKAIPLQSRIIAVVDAYDAMISYRPYRDSLSQQAAAAELLRCAGSQFDPDIVEVFVQTLAAYEETASGCEFNF